MANSALKLFQGLLFAAFLAGSTLPCVAQFDIDFSVAPALAPSLTDSPTTAPVTTLAIDLLAPQRPFIYDATGASISANDLDPTIRTDVEAAAGETDTAIRDSSQTGQISPYGTQSNRLSTLFSGAGAPTSSGAASPPAAGLDEPPTASAAQPYMDYGQPYGSAMPASTAASDDSYRSSWGSGSAAGGSASASTWGGRSASSARSGAGSASESGTGSSLAVGNQSGSSLSSPQTSAAVDDPYRAQPISGIGWQSSGLTRSEPTAAGTPTARTRKLPTTFGAGSTDRFIARPGQVPGQIQDPYAPIPNPAALPTAAGGSQSDAPSFSSRSGAVPSGDSSPFRSFGDVDFLQPDILGAGHVDIFANSRRSSSNRERRPSQLGTTDRQNPLETSSSHYGLDLNRSSTSSLSRSSRNRNGEHVNPYLTQDNSESGHNAQSH